MISIRKVMGGIFVILTKMTGMTMMDDVNDDYDTNDNDDNTDDEVNNDAVVCLLRMLWGFPCYKATTSKHFSLSQQNIGLWQG